jgi:hypothetical protein
VAPRGFAAHRGCLSQLSWAQTNRPSPHHRRRTASAPGITLSSSANLVPIFPPIRSTRRWTSWPFGLTGKSLRYRPCYHCRQSRCPGCASRSTPTSGTLIPTLSLIHTFPLRQPASYIPPITVLRWIRIVVSPSTSFRSRSLIMPLSVPTPGTQPYRCEFRSVASQSRQLAF